MYHWMDIEHLQLYVADFEGRYNCRPLDTIDKTTAIVRGMLGQRLRYIDLIGLPVARLRIKLRVI